jgi:capsid protein
VRETSAAISAIRSGLSSRDDELQKLGRNPEDVDAEIAVGNARVDGLNIVLDSDPRKISQAGQFQQGLADLMSEE